MYESIIPELVDLNRPVLVETSHAISNWTSFGRNVLSNFTYIDQFWLDISGLCRPQSEDQHRV